ncbi:MAG: glycine--tRNA ligase subunit beta [Parvularculaceae bacterium]
MKRLGSLGDKARRVAALARVILPEVGAGPDLSARAAMLAKADLVTGMVYEFPELQGLMGRYYALAQGEDAAVADAIRDHYKPVGADDDAPTAPVSMAVALADKLDTLTAFWSIGKKPTGSSDPFALRRAALGVIAILLDPAPAHPGESRDPAQPVESTPAFAGVSGEGRIGLRNLFELHFQAAITTLGTAVYDSDQGLMRHYSLVKSYFADNQSTDEIYQAVFERERIQREEIARDLLTFIHDRLKVYLRDKGHKHDRIDAVLAKPDGALEDDLVLIVMKLKALETFLATDDGANLVAGYKRAANILRAEAKKGALPDAAAVSEALLQQDEEKALFKALKATENDVEIAVAEERFEDAMSALASLRAAVDAFFEKVTVNADDEKLRANRLSLLQRFIAATAGVADLSKLEG